MSWRFSPGALVPFSSRGSAHDGGTLCLHWAIASGGMIQARFAEPMRGLVYERGRPPYGTCAATGYRYPQAQMVRRGGRDYIPEFAPEEG